MNLGCLVDFIIIVDGDFIVLNIFFGNVIDYFMVDIISFYFDIYIC